MRVTSATSAVVLAAGRGQRMGRDKALLRLGPRTLVEEHVATLRRAGVGPIAVLRRRDAATLPAGVGAVNVVLQPREEATQFDSLVLGLFALGRAPVVVLPVDNDLLRDDTLSRALDAARRAEGHRAIVPQFGGKSGHPVVLLRPGVDAVIRDADDPHGVHRLDHLLARWAEAVVPCAVDDDAVVRDFDRPEDLPGRPT
jgi:CTP:molybdopterin cytidylyltransferase MocA